MNTLHESTQTFTSSQINRLRQLPPEQFLNKLFDKFDQNSDGRLSKFQFYEVIKVLAKITGATFPKKSDIEDLFNFIDTDGDMTINRVEYKQLTKHITSLIKECNIYLYQKVQTIY